MLHRLSVSLWAVAAVSFLVSTAMATPTLSVVTQTLSPRDDPALSPYVQEYLSKSMITNPGNATWRWSDPATPNQNRDMGQTWTPATSYLLDKVAVRVANDAPTSVIGHTVNLDLFRVDGSGNFVLLGRGLGGTLAVTPTKTTIKADSYLVFDVPDTWLSQGNEYGFLLEFDSKNSNNKIDLYHDTAANTYAGGTRIDRLWDTGTARPAEVAVGSIDSTISRPLGGTGGASTYDMVFYTMSPEPATLSLLGLGLLAAMRRRGK